MFRDSDLNFFRRFLPFDTSKSDLDHDVWRLKNAYYGVDLFPQYPDPTLVLFGARSGLEALIALTLRTNLKVYIVESDTRWKDRLAHALAAATSSDAHSRLHWLTSINKLALSGNIATANATVRFDARYARRAVLEAVLSWPGLRHICGDIPPLEIEPMALYRACRAKRISFYCNMVGLHLPIVGAARVPDYEVSVIVPAYNVKPWLDRCLESLTQQTLSSLEIIVVDDGSTDGTGELADRWQSCFAGRVRVIHQINGGCASARMTGINAAKGEYIGFVDADDWVEITMFEDLYRATVLQKAEIAQCGYKEIFQDSGRVLNEPTAWGGDGPLGLTGVTRDPLSYLTVKPTIWRRIYRRDFLNGYNIVFPTHIPQFDDLPFQFEVLSHKKRMAVIPDCHYNYRQEREGQDVAVRDERLFTHISIFAWLNERVMSWADRTIESQLARCEINTHLWALSRIDSKLRSSYLRHAAYQFSTHKRHLGFFSLLRIGASRRGQGLKFVLFSWIARHVFKRLPPLPEQATRTPTTGLTRPLVLVSDASNCPAAANTVTSVGADNIAAKTNPAAHKVAGRNA